MSMHFHKEKHESWFVNQGRFKLRYLDTQTATPMEVEIKAGDTWTNTPLMPHQLEALEDNSSITEVSTPDSIEDNYRIAPGDSQLQQQAIPDDNPTT
jgi:mannose-6-phosphate isomerase-like protein (cupin superfamily)